MEETKISVQGKGAIHIVPDVTRLEVTIEQWFADYGKIPRKQANGLS